MSIWKRGHDDRKMVLILIGWYLLLIPVQIVDAMKEIIVEQPFHLRARIYDAQTASVQFEIARQDKQRVCQRYKFTIRRNREYPYVMPEQNLTFWRNSLELKHLAVGDYRICAIICSEHLKQHHFIKNRSIPISACVNIYAYRSHFLILTLYVLVFIILTFSQIIFTLRKRKFNARIKSALIEVESALQKWRAVHGSSASMNQIQSFNILQNLVTLPASPVEHLTAVQGHTTTTNEHRVSHPIIFHLEP